jgi:exodeoxyribonuclease VII small subunit
MSTKPEPKFEDALAQIERIVGDLESGEPELSSALTKYEQGVRLLAQCYGQLEQAERAVALLTGVDAEGNPVTAPFDATATADRAEAKPRRPGRRKAAATDDDDPDESIPF